MNHFSALSSKLLTGKALTDTIGQWRAAGETIVFTNGCFDIIHRGHVEYLAKAADLGTKLIIGLNSDDSVRRLKGPTRPVNDELARALVLSAFSFVSAVALFSVLLLLQLFEDNQHSCQRNVHRSRRGGAVGGRYALSRHSGDQRWRRELFESHSDV